MTIRASTTVRCTARRASRLPRHVREQQGPGESCPDRHGCEHAPVADAGPDQAVASGLHVQLNGPRPTDAQDEALTYPWSIATRPLEVPRRSTSRSPTPAFTADRPGAYMLELVAMTAATTASPDLHRHDAERSTGRRAGPINGAVGATVTLMAPGPPMPTATRAPTFVVPSRPAAAMPNWRCDRGGLTLTIE